MIAVYRVASMIVPFIGFVISPPLTRAAVAAQPAASFGSATCGDPRIPTRIIGRAPQKVPPGAIGFAIIASRDSATAAGLTMADSYMSAMGDKTKMSALQHDPPKLPTAGSQAAPESRPLQVALRGDSFRCDGVRPGSYVVQVTIERPRSVVAGGRTVTEYPKSIFDGSAVVPRPVAGRITTVQAFGFRQVSP